MRGDRHCEIMGLGRLLYGFGTAEISHYRIYAG